MIMIPEIQKQRSYTIFEFVSIETGFWGCRCCALALRHMIGNYRSCIIHLSTNNLRIIILKIHKPFNKKRIQNCYIDFLVNSQHI